MLLKLVIFKTLKMSILIFVSFSVDLVPGFVQKEENERGATTPARIIPTPYNISGCGCQEQAIWS